jgi:hypothetical protein
VDIMHHMGHILQTNREAAQSRPFVKRKIMQSTATKPKIIRVKIERGTAGLFYATSPNLTGLLVAEDTMEKLEVPIPAAIRDLYAACDVQVFVTRRG